LKEKLNNTVSFIQVVDQPLRSFQNKLIQLNAFAPKNIIKNESKISYLPDVDELYLKIVENLTIEDVIHCMSVDKYGNNVAKDDSLWKAFVLDTFEVYENNQRVIITQAYAPRYYYLVVSTNEYFEIIPENGHWIDPKTQEQISFQII
jgi:aromatic ring-opening dioxygenase LigB subunit